MKHKYFNSMDKTNEIYNPSPSIPVKFSPNDFTKHITAEGYQIKYKGQNIGGAGILGKSTSRGENRRRDIENYNGMANRDIDNILEGHGSQHYLDAIQRLQPPIPVKEGQEVLDITKGEWYVSINLPTPYGNRCYKNVNNTERPTVNSKVITNAFGDTKKEAEANAKAICTAVNGTYGKNLNPAAMEELYKALEAWNKWANLQTDIDHDRLPKIYDKTATILTNAKTIKP